MTSPLGLQEVIRTSHVFGSILKAFNTSLKARTFTKQVDAKKVVMAQEAFLKREEDLQSKQLTNMINVIFYTSSGKSKMHLYASKAKKHLDSQLTELVASSGSSFPKMLDAMKLTSDKFNELTVESNPFDKDISRRKRSNDYSLETVPGNYDQVKSDYIVHFIENYITTGNFLEINNNLGNSFSPNNTKPRRKRQLLELFSGLLGGASMVLSGLNRVELGHLKTAMSAQEGQIKTLHKEIRLNTESISLIHRNLKKVVPLLLKVSADLADVNAHVKFNYLLIYIEDIKTHCQHLLDDLNHQIDSLLHHSLSTKWNRETQLKKAIVTLKKAASTRNMVLFDENPYSLFRFRANLVLIDDKPKIVLRVPIKSREATFSVLKFRNLPFQIGGLKYELRNPHEVLLAGYNDVLFKSLTKDEFAKCIQFRNGNNFWFCPNSDQIYIKNSGTNCLVKLYKGEMHDLRKFCEFKISTLKEKITQISDSSFHVVPLKIPTSINIKCNDHSDDTHYNIKVPTTIKLKPNCRGLTNDHSFTSSFSFEIESDIAPKMIELHPETFLDFIASGDKEMETLRKLVAQVEELSPLEDIDMSRLEKEYQQYTNKFANSFNSYRTEFVLIIIVILAIILFIFIGCLRSRRARTPGSESGGGCCGSLFTWCASRFSYKTSVPTEDHSTEEKEPMTKTTASPTAPSYGPGINISIGSNAEDILEKAATRLGSRYPKVLNYDRGQDPPAQLIRDPQVARLGKD